MPSKGRARRERRLRRLRREAVGLAEEERLEEETRQNTLENVKNFTNDYDMWSKTIVEILREQGIDVVENPFNKRIIQPPFVYPRDTRQEDFPGEGNTHPYFWEGHERNCLLGTESEPHNHVILNHENVYVYGDIVPILKK